MKNSKLYVFFCLFCFLSLTNNLFGENIKLKLRFETDDTQKYLLTGQAEGNVDKINEVSVFIISFSKPSELIILNITAVGGLNPLSGLGKNQIKVLKKIHEILAQKYLANANPSNFYSNMAIGGTVRLISDNSLYNLSGLGSIFQTPFSPGDYDFTFTGLTSTGKIVLIWEGAGAILAQ